MRTTTFSRKCNAQSPPPAEISVVGVRTRARTALSPVSSGNSSSLVKKIRKVSATCNDVSELRKRRRRPENSVSSETMSEVVETAPNCSTGETCSDFPATTTSSCCSSSNNATTTKKSPLEITADPVQGEVASPETSPRCFAYGRAASMSSRRASDEQDSPPRPRRIPVAAAQIIKMPSDSDIDEFFAAAEKNLHKRFTDKYNFNVVKDVPLEGRYEWVPIKP